jgi:hypothetical protein
MHNIRGACVRVSKAYFSDSELACKGKTCKCNTVKLNPIFDSKLLQLRVNVNEPMKVNSCSRCDTHNKVVKGAKRSFHLYDDTGFKTNGTCAIDIPRGDTNFNIKLLLEAWELGFSIGVHPSFFHLDVRSDVSDKPQIVFSYGKTDPKDLAKWKRLVK